MSMTVSSTPDPTPPPPSSDPISKQDVKDLAQKELHLLKDTKFQVKGDVKEVNGKYTFKVGDGIKTYTITVGKDVLAGLTSDEAKKTWSKGLALQIDSMYKGTFLRSSFNLVDRSITINNVTYYFKTQEQVEQHKQAFATLRDDFSKLEEASTQQTKKIGKTTQEIAKEQTDVVKGKWYQKAHPRNETKIEQLQGDLNDLRTERRSDEQQKNKVAQQIKVMGQLHLLAGQLFVEGGLEHSHLLPASASGTNITDTSQIPELPPMPTLVGSTTLAASTSPQPFKPTTYMRAEDLEHDLLANQPAFKVSPMTVNDGMTDRVKSLLRTADEFNRAEVPFTNLTPMDELRAQNYSSLELRAIFRGMKDIAHSLGKEKVLNLSIDPQRRGYIETTVKQLEDYQTELKKQISIKKQEEKVRRK